MGVYYSTRGQGFGCVQTSALIRQSALFYIDCALHGADDEYRSAGWHEDPRQMDNMETHV